MEGRNTDSMMFSEVTWPPIHSIVVVTSPIGVQAPPALAAMTMMPAKNRRSSCLARILRISEIATMVVVRLSRMAERKKVTKPTSHIRDELRRPDALGDDFEAVVRVHDLDDRHRPHQEEGDLRSTHQGFAELVGDDVMVARAEGVDRPQQAGTNERRGRLVDLERVPSAIAA